MKCFLALLVKRSISVGVALSLCGGAALAANSAFDTASNYAPSSWSTTPANLGSGFGPWNIVVQNNTSPPYVGTYLDNGSAVVSGGFSWGTYANTGGLPYGQENFIRPFTGGALSAPDVQVGLVHRWCRQWLRRAAKLSPGV